MTVLLWLLPALPAGVGGLLAVSGRRGQRLALPGALVVATLVLAAAAALAAGRPRVAAGWLPGLPASLAVDGLSGVMALTVAAVCLAVLVFAGADIGPDQARGRFFGLMLVFEGAMLATVTTTSLGVLLAAWEVMGAVSYGLIGYWWREPGRVASANTAFLTTRAGDLGLYLAAGATLAGTGTLSLAGMARAGSPWVSLAAGGVVVAALGKSAQLPFSFWLSRAMDGPSPVSALLHSATMVAAGAYLVLRLQPLLGAVSWAGPLVAWAGAVTAVVMALVALTQDDLKALLAASTCSQVGFMFLAAGTADVPGGAAVLVAHGATKALLFLGAGALLSAFGTRALSALVGTARRWPVLAATTALGAWSLAGLAPLSLWAAKDQVLAGAVAQGGLYAVGAAAGLASAAYSARLAMVLLGRGSAKRLGWDEERAGTRRFPPAMAVPMVALAVASVGLAAVALPPLESIWARTLGAPPVSSRNASLALTSALALLGGAGALAWPRWAPKAAPPPALAAAIGWFHDWLGLEGLARAVVGRPILALARALARFDDAVVDGGVRGVSGAAGLAGHAASFRLEAVMDGAVQGLAASAERLGRLARRPQSGQLHQYYAQAVVALGIMVAVVLVVR